ncbi:DeoR/GlpR family DNA-binding transcription regulator [Ruegeria sp. 2205SS24-7]|uniref:DeoR/GlpR family DNA-binding transcription regulator n=1 Tax=Ruegeria discodermiae TaxID=3064389 RepID=UPI0027418F6D|nr:DeoR/GlpR family DNA-binding transcription regulator [Ruegeria sp. 2205SS24-7]MDP5217173.1 DeoR/GlpR family DNA-binding transcription regulator [Ruegeria sp. 2205SS24-7]
MASDMSSFSHREMELLSALRRAGGSARGTELAKVMNVSEETVRRTIKSLATSGALVRVHGGAYLIGTRNDPSFFRRINKHAEEKRLIAATIAGIVTDGMTLFLDVGSTTAFVAEELRHHHADLTVVTNSIGVAQTLVNINGNRVHMLGGELQSNERGTFGHVAERQARRFAYDVAVLSSDALSAERGFLYLSAAEAHLATEIAASARQVLMGIDRHKFGATAPHCGPEPEAVHQVVSDQAPRGRLSAALRSWNIDVTTAL